MTLRATINSSLSCSCVLLSRTRGHCCARKQCVHDACDLEGSPPAQSSFYSWLHFFHYFHLISCYRLSTSCGGAERVSRGPAEGRRHFCFPHSAFVLHALCLAARLTEYEQRLRTAFNDLDAAEGQRCSVRWSAVWSKRPLPAGEALLVKATPRLCCEKRS